MRSRQQQIPLVAEKVDAIFTPQDNTVMTAELAIFENLQTQVSLTTQVQIPLL